MTQLKISVSNAVAKEDVLVLAAYPNKDGVELLQGDHLSASQLSAIGVSGKAEAIVRTLSPSGQSLAVVGVGSESPTVDEWREIGGAIGRGLGGVKTIALDLGVSDIASAVALLEGVALGNYSYAGRESKSKLKAVTLVTGLSISKSDLDRVSVLARAVHVTRDLAATPANELYPAMFAEIAEKAAEKRDVDIEVLDEKALKKEGYGLIAAVGMGSARPPRLVKLTYSPKNASKHLALIGKGITFDTGGLAVKPLGGMLGMKYDMAGAATVYSTILAIADLALPIKVTAFLCLAENMPSGSAMRPGDVFKSKSGKTVEVTNPDAEGRLVLADGIAAASALKPNLIVDVATLTGAARIALGARYTGLMGSAAGVAALQQATAASGEPAWAMPLPKELRASLDSPVADLQNAKVGSTFGGMLVGGWFLSEFVGNGKDGQKLDWAHLDIAGPADNEGAPYGFTPAGPTGVMVRSLVNLAEAMAAE